MRKEIEVSGKTVDEAIETAKAILGADLLADIEYEVTDLGTKGIFGIGARPAKIKAYMEVADPAPVRRRHERQPDEETIKKAIAEEKKKKAVAPKKAETEKSADEDEDVTLEPVDAKEGEDRSLDLINTLIANLGIKAEAKLYKCSNGSRRIIISGEEAGTLIGHHGDTLDSIQYLSNLACIKRNIKGERDRSRVTVDIEGYRSKREETLRALARKKAAKALRDNRSVVLEPMNAYERRIIHSEVHTIEGVTTNSIGTDNNRKVVIYVQKNKEEDSSSENE